jgi:hypothetical protein
MPLPFSTTCQYGRLQITQDGHLRQTCSYDERKAWSLPMSEFVSFEVKYTPLTASTVIYTAFGYRIVNHLPREAFRRLLVFFPGRPVTQVQQLTPIARWFLDPEARTHIGEYTDAQVAQKEMEAAYQQGWTLQAQSTTGGQVNVGAIIAGEILLGPLGALAASGRSKDKITLAFVRPLKSGEI